MESAKNAVKDFMHKAGKHDTTVTEQVAPAVQHETVNRTQHEQATTAIDKETHQDHYHTSVQPIKDREVLPEQHHHNLVPVEHRKFEHGNAKDVETKLATEAAQFKDETRHVKGEHTHSVAPVVGGEHIHHHVHETIQPVVNKETIEPHVVHTTVPIHEVHHNAAQHHSTSALPAVSMAEFKKQGGVLGGREARHDGFEGEPRHVASALGGDNTTGHHSHNPLSSHTGSSNTTGSVNPLSSGNTTGNTTTGSVNPLNSGHTVGNTGSHNPLSSNTGTTGTTGGLTGSSNTGATDRSGLTGTGNTSTTGGSRVL